MGAPTWPPFPHRFGAPRPSRGAPLSRHGGSGHGPHSPPVRRAPAKPWRAFVLHGGPDMAPIPPAFGAPRRSRGAPLSYMGAPTWPPFPRALGTPRRSRGAPLDGGR